MIALNVVLIGNRDAAQQREGLESEVIAEHGHQADHPAAEADTEADRESVHQRHGRGVYEHHGADAEDRHENAPEVLGIDAVAEQHDDEFGDQAGNRHGEYRRTTDARRMTKILEHQLALRQEQRVHATAAQQRTQDQPVGGAAHGIAEFPR